MGALGTHEHSVEIDGKTLTFEAGKLAQQAGGAVVVSLGDTKVLTTTTASSQPKEFLGFFPLTIEVEERMYAAGRIPGSFFAREGRPGESAVLTCRLTDRPLRPTFVDGLRHEIQVVNTVLQTAQFDPYDVVAMNASSISTMLAGVPFHGPVASVRYGMDRNGDWIAFPSFEELDEDVVFQMVIAGRVDGDEVAILMIEAEATDDAIVKIDMGAPKPTEEVIGAAIESVKPLIRQLCEAQQAFVDSVGVRQAGEFALFLDYEDGTYERILALAGDRVAEIYGDASTNKETKNEALSAAKDEAVAAFLAEQGDDADLEDLGKQARNAFRSVEKKVVRRMITEQGVRVDGRGAADLRPVTAEVGVLPHTHGTGLFQRGDTQVLSVLALGTTRSAQRIDSLDPVEHKLYMHHYNMPPYSTGETGRVGSPKRREIGHGLLAERALKPVLPDTDTWPYAMRIVSDILSSNGSTSMGSVCGSTLALMDGGVPIHAPVAGIAMGLIYENGTYTTLTDIQGVEDFYGDMDFKVAGTREFVTALQLDTKLTGIPSDVLAAALLQAKDARLTILDVMAETIAEPRPEVAATAPRVEIVYIPQDKIGDVIGPRGKIIKELVEVTGAQIDVDEEGGQGVVKIYANEKSVADDAVARINAIANPVVPEVGERFNATVVKTADFGAFVSLTPGTDGLLHISELKKMVGRRLDHAEEAVNVGDTVLVEVLDVLDGGRKFKLEYVGPKAEPVEGEGGGDRGGRDRGGDRGGRGRGGDRGGGDRGGDRGGRGGGDRGGDRERGGGDRGGDRERGGGDRERGGGDRGGDRERGGGDRGGDRERGGGDGGGDRERGGGDREGGRERSRSRSRTRERD